MTWFLISLWVSLQGVTHSTIIQQFSNNGDCQQAKMALYSGDTMKPEMTTNFYCIGVLPKEERK